MQKNLMLTTLLLAITIGEITAKVALKGNMTGIAYRRKPPGGHNHDHLSVDLTNYFDFNLSKNPNFSINQIGKGELRTVNTLQSSIQLDGEDVIFFMELPNKIAKLVSSRTLRLLDLDPNGKITSFNDISLKNTDLDHCFDMRYIKEKNVLVLGCLDDPHEAQIQMYFVYSFETQRVVYTEYDQSQEAGLEIAGRMVPAGDGVICYIQNAAFTSFYFWKIEDDLTLSKEKVSYRLTQKMANPVDSMRHEFYYDGEEWRRRLVVFEDSYNGKMISSYNMAKDDDGQWIVVPVQTVLKDLQMGACLFASANQKLSWCCDEGYSQLTHCRTYGGKVMSDYQRECGLMTGVSTHFIDLTPVRVSTGDERFGIVHYRTWPRRSIGGNMMFPGRDLYPKFVHITTEYNLDDSMNYTMIRNNIYSFGTEKAEHYRVMNPQYSPNLELEGSYEVEVVCKDDDNQVTLVIPVQLYEGLGGVDLGLESVEVQPEAGKRMYFDVFPRRFKGNMVKAGSFGDEPLFFNDMGNLVIIDKATGEDISPLKEDVFYFCKNSFFKYSAENQQILWYRFVSFSGNELQVTLAKKFEAEDPLTGKESLECTLDTFMLKLSSTADHTSFLLITNSTSSKRTISPPARPARSEIPSVLPWTTSSQFRSLRSGTTILTSFVSKAVIPPTGIPQNQIQIMKIVEGKNNQYYPEPLTVHSSTLFYFCPVSFSFTNSTSNRVSILSVCPLTTPDEPPRVDLIQARYDDFDFEVERKVSLYLGNDFLLHADDAQICRFGDEELFVISVTGNLVYSVDIKNPENYRKIDFSGFGQISKSSTLLGFRCLQTTGVLGLIFNNGVAGIKAGELFDTTSRFLFFSQSQGETSSVEDLTTTSGDALIIIRDYSRDSLTYYNMGVPKLTVDLRSSSLANDAYLLKIGNEETKKTLVINISTGAQLQTEEM